MADDTPAGIRQGLETPAFQRPGGFIDREDLIEKWYRRAADPAIGDPFEAFFFAWAALLAAARRCWGTGHRRPGEGYIIKQYFVRHDDLAVQLTTVCKEHLLYFAEHANNSRTRTRPTPPSLLWFVDPAWDNLHRGSVWSLLKGRPPVTRRTHFGDENPMGELVWGIGNNLFRGRPFVNDDLYDETGDAEALSHLVPIILTALELFEGIDPEQPDV